MFEVKSSKYNMCLEGLSLPTPVPKVYCISAQTRKRQDIPSVPVSSPNRQSVWLITYFRNDDGTILAMFYKGTVKLTEGVKAILSGSPDAKTTEYGDSFVTFTFETGSEKYKELQNGTYVASGHFITGEDGVQGVVVEYKVSKVVM
jgi:hypothetical protein